MAKILRPIFLGWCCCLSVSLFAQVSILTDASILRNFNKQQKFWAFGQTVQGNYHPSKKEAVYAWISYYTNGRFKNNFRATAKDPLANPQQQPYTVYSSLRYRHISVGWKHYFTGSYESEENIWNFYGYAGFGLLIGKAENRYSNSIDTAKYNISSPYSGIASFKRLTFDAGLGTEIPLGADVRLYTEVRTWIASSHYPSPYLLKDNYQIPAVAAVNMGIRILMQ